MIVENNKTEIFDDSSLLNISICDLSDFWATWTIEHALFVLIQDNDRYLNGSLRSILQKAKSGKLVVSRHT